MESLYLFFAVMEIVSTRVSTLQDVLIFFLNDCTKCYVFSFFFYKQGHLRLVNISRAQACHKVRV